MIQQNIEVRFVQLPNLGFIQGTREIELNKKNLKKKKKKKEEESSYQLKERVKKAKMKGV